MPELLWLPWIADGDQIALPTTVEPVKMEVFLDPKSLLGLYFARYALR